VCDGHRVVGFDCVRSTREDVRDGAALAAALRGVDGVVHLAAVSRVAVAHAEPERCWAVNVGGTEALLGALRPDQWVVFASSREVYGTPAQLPATEDAPLQPLNVYARAKVVGERMVRAHPGPNAVVRLSNAYGPTADHPDRVVPAFARAAAVGGVVRVDGADRTFDFVHLSDVVAGLRRLVAQVAARRRPPVVHLTTGQGTSLGDLAALAMDHGAGGSVPGPERDFDVERFVGDPSRAERVLGWKAGVSLADGFARLVDAFGAGAR